MSSNILFCPNLKSITSHGERKAENAKLEVEIYLAFLLENVLK